MAERTQQILPGGQQTAPYTYTLPASTAFTLMGVRALIDGTAASGAFLPCIQLVSDASVVMAQTIGSSVAAGGSTDVTAAPFLESASAGGGTDPNAVHYNAAGESGSFLTTLSTGASGTHINDTGGGIYLTSSDATFGFIDLQSANQVLVAGSRASLSGTGQIDVQLAAFLADFRIVDFDGHIVLQCIDGTGRVKLQVNDQTGSPIFQVRDDGSIHGRAAVGAITWDL